MHETRTDTAQRRKTPAYWLYGVVLLASSAAMFGMAGVLLGVLFLPAWYYVFRSRRRPMALAHVVAVLVLGFCLICVPMRLAPASFATAA